MNEYGPHILYRLCDGGRRLLYVGITLNPLRRLRGHCETQVWWGQVSEIYFEHHASRELLLIAEMEAIRAEHPLYNIAGNSRTSEGAGRPFDLLPCPACGVESFYRRTMDRFYHLDGSDNLDCWVSCTRGEIEIGTTNIFGRELTCRTWPTVSLSVLEKL